MNGRTGDFRARQGGTGDRLFLAGQVGLLGSYVLLIVALLAALAMFTSPSDFAAAIASPEIRYALRLSLLSCTLTSMLCLWIAIPAGYVLSRYRFAGRNLIDAVLDIPIVLPPLVLGLALLILFNRTPLGRAVERIVPVTFAVPSVVLAQFSVACAFAVRTMRVTFDQIDPRSERWPSRWGAAGGRPFGWLPCRRPAAASSRRPPWPGPAPWASSARSSSSPGLPACGRRCLPTSIFLEMSTGSIEAAAAVSLMMAVTALVVLVAARLFGLHGTGML